MCAAATRGSRGRATTPSAETRSAKRCLDKGWRQATGAQPSGAMPRQMKLRTSNTHHGHQGRNQDWTLRRQKHPASIPAAGALYPVFILLTITKAIYLFHLEQKFCFGHFSLACSVASLPPAPSPGCVCLTCRPPWALPVARLYVGTGTRVCLFGSLDLQFPGGSAPSSQAGPWGRTSLTCNMVSWGAP